MPIGYKTCQECPIHISSKGTVAPCPSPEPHIATIKGLIVCPLPDYMNINGCLVSPTKIDTKGNIVN
jgi:hypothetical protein